MALPREVRDMVYEHIVEYLPKIIDVSKDRLLAPAFQLEMDGNTQTVAGGSENLPLVTFLPGIAYVNDIVYAEFVPTYLRKIHLQIGETPNFLYLENFFETLPRGKGWERIVNLTILNLAEVARTPSRATEMMDTIHQAVNLQVLVLNFRLQDFYLPPDWPETPTSKEEACILQNNPPKTVDARYFMREYQFDQLFEMEHLKRLIIKVEHGFFEHDPRSVQVLGDLKEYLMERMKYMDGVEGVTCQDVDVFRPGISVFILGANKS
jgi:hypothetical protein